MSLASRHATGTSGNNHAIPQPTVTTVAPGPFQVNQHHMGRGNNPYPNFFSGGLSVPRQITVHARGALDNAHIPIKLNFVGTIGQGTFGQIERATLHTGDQVKDGDSHAINVAVKRVLQDPRYKNRELSIMQRLNNHPNVVKFYYYYYSTSSNSKPSRVGSNRSGSGSSGVDVFLHLVLECFPESLCELIYRYSQRNLKIPIHIVKIFTYQMLKALAYLHENQICHRDIKSSNLLVNESTLILKVCDFGSAKEMIPGTANVSYISSRYYRAPELLFGAQMYTCAIDIWSGGCVLAEMLRQHCLFTGTNSLDQLVKVIRVLGTPSEQDIASMNPMYCSYNFPDVQSCPVKLFFPHHTPSDLLALMSSMLVYNPLHRIEAAAALNDACFDELRYLGPTGVLPNQVPMPPHLFDPHPPTAVSLSANDDDASLNCSAVGPKVKQVTQNPVNMVGTSVDRATSGTALTNDENCRRRNHNKQVPPPQNHSANPGGDGINNSDNQRKGRIQHSLHTGPSTNPSGNFGPPNDTQNSTVRPNHSTRKVLLSSSGKNGVTVASSSCHPGKRPSDIDHHNLSIDGVCDDVLGAQNQVSVTGGSNSGRHDDSSTSTGGGDNSNRTPVKQPLSESSVTATSFTEHVA